MTIEIYADGASVDGILELNKNPIITGFTTNPTLMKKAGITDYRGFAKKVLSKVKDKPISFEIFSDYFEEMYKQAKEISSWAPNVFVKIPYYNTEGVSMSGLIKILVSEGVKVNLTAVFSYEQIKRAIKDIGNEESIISVFAGRISDAGYDPRSFIEYAKYNKYPRQKILWASTREVWNIKHAEDCGADIITVGHDILKKYLSAKKDLELYSLETVRMFYNDAIESGFTL
jgi:transaldolase